MVRFSCFHAHNHSHKHKKAVQPSMEAMQKTLQDFSQDRAPDNMTCPSATNSLQPKVVEDNNSIDHATDFSPVGRDCKSEGADGKFGSDCDVEIHNSVHMKKSKSLGCGLNWEGRASGDDDSEDETGQRSSCNGSDNQHELVVPDSGNKYRIDLPDQSQEAVPSDSLRVNSDLFNNGTLFSIGDPLQPEKEVHENSTTQLACVGESGGCTPCTPTVVVKSSSLPNLGSPVHMSRESVRHIRSAEDLNLLGSRKKDASSHKLETQVLKYRAGDDKTSNCCKYMGDNLIDDNYDNYNYVGSAKDWIVPAADDLNREKNHQGSSSFFHLNYLPSKDFRIKRIEEWVMDLQHCTHLEEASEFSKSNGDGESKGKTVLNSSPAARLDGKVNSGMETVKNYLSTLSATATSAQLANHGLVVIPFLSAFGSLRAVNLSGNTIVRITAGALPRGLHILNLSRNNICAIEGLRELTRLRVLDLSYNRILRIGHGLASCASLKELYLAGNKISEVEGLHRLLKLNVLDLRFNKISTAKCLGQLAANYNSLQAISLEGNPAQKNVGDEQLKKYLQSLLPHLIYFNRQSMKIGGLKDTTDRSALIGISAHQIDRGIKTDLKNMRKGTHGTAAHRVSSSSTHGRKSQQVASPKPSKSRHVRLPPSGTKTSATRNQVYDFNSLLSSLRPNISMRRSRSEGTLGAL